MPRNHAQVGFCGRQGGFVCETHPVSPSVPPTVWRFCGMRRSTATPWASTFAGDPACHPGGCSITLGVFQTEMQSRGGWGLGGWKKVCDCLEGGKGRSEQNSPASRQPRQAS